jgi:hypothetical protein
MLPKTELGVDYHKGKPGHSSFARNEQEAIEMQESLASIQLKYSCIRSKATFNIFMWKDRIYPQSISRRG